MSDMEPSLITADGERVRHWGDCTVLYADEFPMDLPPGKYIMASNVYMQPIELAYTLKNANLRGTDVETEDRTSGVSGQLPAQRLRLAIRRIVDRRRRRMRLLDTRTENAPNASEDYP